MAKVVNNIVLEMKGLPYEYSKQLENEIKLKAAKILNVDIKKIKFNFIPIATTSDNKSKSLVAEIKDNIQNPEFHKQLIKKYIDDKQYKNVDIDALYDIDNQVNDNVDFNSYSNNKNYKFKYAKWSNFLSYGENNYFDFTQLKGLVLLNSEPGNQGGKTTFAIDLLKFGLYGKCDKFETYKECINRYAQGDIKTAFVEVGIEFDGIDYVIHREVIQDTNKKGNKTNEFKRVSTFYKKEGDELIKLPDEAIIKEVIGNINDFELVVSATHDSLNNLLKLKQADASTLYAKWMGTQIIIDKGDKAKKIFDNVKKGFKPIDKEASLNDITELNNVNNAYSQQIIDDKKKITTLENEKLQHQQEIDNLRGKLVYIDDNVKNINVTSCQNNLGICNTQLQTYNNQLLTVENEIKELEKITFNPDDRETCKQQYNINKKNIDDAINTCKNELEKLRTSKIELEKEKSDKGGVYREKLKQLNEYKSLLAQGICPTCLQKIDQNEHIQHTQNYQDELNQILSEGHLLKNKINVIEEQMKVLEDNISSKYSELDLEQLRYETQMNDLNTREKSVMRKAQKELSVQVLKANINSTIEKINQINADLESVKKNEEVIKHNADIQSSIVTHEASITSLNNAILTIDRAITTAQANIDNNNTTIEKIQKTIDTYNRDVQIAKNWNLYIELFNRDGIAKLMLKESLPVINNSIRVLLKDLCDFEFSLELDENNCIIPYIIKEGGYKNKVLSLSGYESTMSALALRSALGMLGTMSKPNFLCTDEVIGQVHPSNYDNLFQLYERIAQNYDFIINIVHVPEAYDYHKQIIKVIKENNISKIEFSTNNKM